MTSPRKNWRNYRPTHLYSVITERTQQQQSNQQIHYSDVIMSAMTSQIAGVSTACSGADQRNHQISASLAIVKEIHRWAVNSPHNGPVTWKMFHQMTPSCADPSIAVKHCLITRAWFLCQYHVRNISTDCFIICMFSYKITIFPINVSLPNNFLFYNMYLAGLVFGKKWIFGQSRLIVYWWHGSYLVPEHLLSPWWRWLYSAYPNSHGICWYISWLQQ